MPREAHHSRNWGGIRAGQGRKPGTTSKYQKANERRALESGEHPVDFMLGIMRDTKNDMRLRMHACHAVLPYVAARLNTVDLNIKGDLEGMSLLEKLSKAESLRTNIIEQQPDFMLPGLPVLNQAEPIEGELVEVAK